MRSGQRQAGERRPHHSQREPRSFAGTRAIVALVVFWVAGPVERMRDGPLPTAGDDDGLQPGWGVRERDGMVVTVGCKTLIVPVAGLAGVLPMGRQQIRVRRRHVAPAPVTVTA